MKRRAFLQNGSIFSLPLLLNGNAVSVLGNTFFSPMLEPEDDRVLILIQLNGGSDGLNTLIPLDQYSGLSLFRPNILIPENKVLKIEDANGLHPAMSEVQQLYLESKVSFVQNVAYPNQNRSHFRSSDIWNSGSNADEFLNTGWLGRYLDGIHPEFPEAYPNADYPHPIALSIGPTSSETCQGIAANFSLAVNNPETLNTIPGVDEENIWGGYYGEELDYLRLIIKQTNAYAQVLQDIYDQGSNLSDLYQDSGGRSNLSNQMAAIARLISGGLKTKIFVANMGGFDTHANQTEEGDPTSGFHADLLGQLSNAVYAFMDDMKKAGQSHRILIATMSEFGRKIVSNAALGTDHGEAAPLMLFGECVNQGIVGNNPQINQDTSTFDGVPMEVDFRDVFGSLLIDWFGAGEDEVANIFTHNFKYMPLITACNNTVSTNTPFIVSMNVYPNPFVDYINIDLESTGADYQFTLIDTQGKTVQTKNVRLPKGQHQYTFEIDQLLPGQYIMQVNQNGSQQRSVQLLHF